MANLRHITGVKAVFARMHAVTKAADKFTEIGLKRAGLYLQRASQKVTPVLYGGLRRSARTKMEGSGFHATAHVTFGENANYAIFVHERTDLRHAEGTKAKFLTDTAIEKEADLAQIIGDSQKNMFDPLKFK